MLPRRPALYLIELVKTYLSAAQRADLGGRAVPAGPVRLAFLVATEVPSPGSAPDQGEPLLSH